MQRYAMDDFTSRIDLELFAIEPLPKEEDKRGYIYVIQDSAFKGYLKIGRTQNIKKRLTQYNADKPYSSSYLVCISREFTDVHSVEKKILSYLYDHTSPTTLSREWFENQWLDTCIDLIEQAEKEFN